MSTTFRIALSYALVAAVAVVAGLAADSGLLLLVGALVALTGFLHASRGRTAAIEHRHAQQEAAVREGNAEPERHGGW